MTASASSGGAPGSAHSTPPAAPIVARRGRQWLTREDLQAHFASLLRLENVGLLLGSGASVGVGGKTMWGLWQDFCDKSKAEHQWLLDNAFINTADPPNAEKLGDVLAIAELEWTRAKDPKLPDLRNARAALQRAVLRAVLLQTKAWSDPDVEPASDKLRDHRAVLQKLVGARQPGQSAPWIFTTNYDLAIEWAAESLGLKLINGFDGLHRRAFAPHNFDLAWRNALARGEARFGTYHAYLLKLHGSLTWYRTAEGGVLEGSSAARWPHLENFVDGKTTEVPGLLVLPSVTKYDQTVGFLLGELVRRFAEFLSRPQTVLFTCGYSCSDDHLNRLLTSALQNPTLHLVVLVPEAERDVQRLVTSKCSAWAQRVAELESPQVTIVGGGPDAYFSRLADMLPDPAVYDEQALKMRAALRELAQVSGSKVDP